MRNNCDAQNAPWSCRYFQSYDVFVIQYFRNNFDLLWEHLIAPLNITSARKTMIDISTFFWSSEIFCIYKYNRIFLSNPIACHMAIIFVFEGRLTGNEQLCSFHDSFVWPTPDVETFFIQWYMYIYLNKLYIVEHVSIWCYIGIFMTTESLCEVLR